MNDVIQAPPHLNVQIRCVRSENSFKQNQKPYRKYVFELFTSTGHRWEMSFRYTELQSLYDHIVKQFPKHKLSPFPAKVNPFKSEGLVIQERQTAFDTILKEMVSHTDICDCFQLQHFFQIKKHVYGDNTQGINQGTLWIKIIEAVGLELEENTKAELSPQLKMRISVPLNHSYHPPTLATQVFNNNKHAKWFEEFSVSLPNKEFPIQFKVWNHRTLASNQLLGRFELDIRPFASNQVHDLWLQISKTARLHVMFQFSEAVLPSEPKNQINLKLPDLRLVLDRTTVYPGEMVTGGVIFNVGNPLSVKDITLKFFGAEHTRWKQEVCGNERDHNGHRIVDSHMIRRSESAVLFNIDQVLFAQQPVIDSGSYYWPFSFVMPLNLPPSMEHPFAAVTYTCSAHVNRPGLSLNKHVSNEIKVVVNYASSMPTPAVAVKEKKLNFRSKDQVILLSGKLEEGNIAEIGGQKLLSFTIENKSNYDVKSMRITLNSTLLISANGFPRTFCTSNPLTLLNGKEGMGLPVRSGRTLMGQIELKFPQRLFPTIFAQHSPLIEVTHSLVMECAVSGFLTGSVSTSIPMVFNNNTSPELAKIQQPLVPQGDPMTVSVDFMPGTMAPMPPINSPALFEQQYGVNFLSLNQMPDATPQFD
jgi:hypothetical protein